MLFGLKRGCANAAGANAARSAALNWTMLKREKWPTGIEKRVQNERHSRVTVIIGDTG